MYFKKYKVVYHRRTETPTYDFDSYTINLLKEMFHYVDVVTDSNILTYDFSEVDVFVIGAFGYLGTGDYNSSNWNVDIVNLYKDLSIPTMCMCRGTAVNVFNMSKSSNTGMYPSFNYIAHSHPVIDYLTSELSIGYNNSNNILVDNTGMDSVSIATYTTHNHGILLKKTSNKDVVFFGYYSTDRFTFNGFTIFRQILHYLRGFGSKRVSLNKPYTSNYTLVPYKAYSNVTNGGKNYLNYVSVSNNNGNPVYIQIDLEDVMVIDTIRVWRYYQDSREFKGTKLEVSVDGVIWHSIFDSSLKGTYPESSNGSGKTFMFPPTTVRYIRDWENGSNKNTVNIWVQIEAYGVSSDVFPELESEGTWYSEPISLNSVPDVVDRFVLNWEEENVLDNLIEVSCFIGTNVLYNPEDSEYVKVTKNESIPTVLAGSELIGKYLWVKVYIKKIGLKSLPPLIKNLKAIVTTKRNNPDLEIIIT